MQIVKEIGRRPIFQHPGLDTGLFFGKMTCVKPEKQIIDSLKHECEILQAMQSSSLAALQPCSHEILRTYIRVHTHLSRNLNRSPSDV